MDDWQIVEKALVIKEKKTQYMVMERDCLTLCRHPGIVKLTATFQVCRISRKAHLPLMENFVSVCSVHPPHRMCTDIPLNKVPAHCWSSCNQVLAATLLSSLPEYIQCILKVPSFLPLYGLGN
jgi:hypothetical protein